MTAHELAVRLLDTLDVPVFYGDDLEIAVVGAELMEIVDSKAGEPDYAIRLKGVYADWSP